MSKYRKDKNGKHWQSFASLTPWNKGVYILESVVDTLKIALYFVVGWFLFSCLICILGG